MRAHPLTTIAPPAEMPPIAPELNPKNEPPKYSELVLLFPLLLTTLVSLPVLVPV